MNVLTAVIRVTGKQLGSYAALRAKHPVSMMNRVRYTVKLRYSVLELIYYCTDAAMHRCTEILMYRCTEILMYRCTEILMYRCTNVLKY